MKLLRAYWRLVTSLLRSDARDSGDIREWLVRRQLATLLIAIVVVPVVVGGMLAYDHYRDIVRIRKLEESVCVRRLPASAIGDELDLRGYASDGRCDAYWRRGSEDVLKVTWLAHSPGAFVKERTIERWHSDGPEQVREVEDASGKRFIVIEPVAGGRLTLSGPAEKIPLVAAVLGRRDRD